MLRGIRVAQRLVSELGKCLKLIQSSVAIWPGRLRASLNEFKVFQSASKLVQRECRLACESNRTTFTKSRNC